MDQQHMPPDDGYYYSQDDGYLAYPPQQISPYPVVQPQTHFQQPAGMYQGISMIPSHQFQPVYPASSPPHVSLPLSASPPPPSPDPYDPLSPPISGSDTSADGIYNSSGQNSPSSSRANSLVHRSVRYNPTPSPTSSSGRRRGRSQDSDEDTGNDMTMINLAHTRKEATRRQRIEAEQRRRDELRDGYAKLKDVLPVSNQKSSKVSLLDRATHHIVALEKTNKDLQARITALEQELQRLRSLNEKISLTSTEAASPGLYEARPLSPPPDVPPPHSLANVRGQEPLSDESSPSGSDGF